MIVREREFIEEIKSLGLGVFTLSDISRIIGKGKRYAALYANRLVKRGIIVRIERGKFALPDTDSLVVATNVTFPSYVSFLSALSYHRLTAQIPTSIQVVAGKSKKGISFKGEKISFVRFDRKRIFGYRREKIGNGYAFIGEVEKIIVDALFMPRYCPLGELMEALDVADVDKLLRYALKMNSIVTLKRLGYLLELKNIDIYDEVKKYINRKYDLLNPLLPPAGETNRKWALRLNEVLEC